MPQFKKGQVANPAGKKKGTLNVTTREAREILNKILFAEMDNIKDSLAKIRENDEYKYLDILGKLLQFSLPRKTDLTSDDKGIQSITAINYIVPDDSNDTPDI